LVRLADCEALEGNETCLVEGVSEILQCGQFFLELSECPPAGYFEFEFEKLATLGEGEQVVDDLEPLLLTPDKQDFPFFELPFHSI
jgi:hypothetical protein